MLTQRALTLVAAIGGVLAIALAGDWLNQSVLGKFAAVTLFAIVATSVLTWWPQHHPHRRFGPANQITFARAALACLLAGTLPTGGAPSWTLAAVAGIAALLDALDGWCARRTHLVSRFGARFDQEVDALLILVLSLLAWRFERAGAWVLLSGLMRYAFVGATLVCPWLAAPLPSSQRRKVICVVQVVALLLCLLPAVPGSVAYTFAAIGLLALAGSFATDLAWLAATRRTTR